MIVVRCDTRAFLSTSKESRVHTLEAEALAKVFCKVVEIPVSGRGYGVIACAQRC